MRKISKKTIGLLLVIVLCFSMMPMSAMATAEGTAPAITEENPDNQGGAPADEPNDEAPKPSAGPEIEGGEVAADQGSDTPDDQDGEMAVMEQEDSEAPASIEVDPEYVKVVDKPLVQVVYNYYDEAQSVTGFADYAVTSTHSYNALAMANGDAISIAANKYPAQVPVSTDALRFRVLLNGSEDITAQASYDAATGLVSLPPDFMGHNITVVWYCPMSEVTQLPVTVTMSIYENGAFVNSTQEITVASDASTITIPLAESNGLVVSQGGIDLEENAYSMSGDLNIFASPLGGDISVTAYTAVMRAMSGGMSTMGATTQVVHTRSSSQIYYGYYTSYYTANGNTAFCLDPTVSGLAAGTYDVSGYLTRGTGYDDLIKAAYYLYGGPAYDSVKNNLFGSPDSMEAYGLCHAAVAYMWLDNPAAFTGLDSSTIQHLQNLIAAINAQAMPPEGFEVFLYNVGSSTNQSLMSWEYTPTSNLEIVKKSNNTAFTSNNDCYSLEGAVFGVYNGSDEKIGSITTDKNGKGTLEGIAANQTGLYILEEKPPKGYAEHTEKIPFEIVSGQTTTVEVKNKPQGDPVTILLRKQDADTKTNTPQGMASLENAEFTIRYYKGDYTASELSGKTPARTWIVKTNANGFAMLHPDFLVAGSDPLYFASNGTTPTIPLGTVTVQESKSPSGYLLNDELYVRYSTTEGRREAVNTYNEPIVPDTVIRGGVSIQKWDFELNRPAQPQGDADLAATLDIYNRSTNSIVVDDKTYAPDAIVYTMKTDAATGAAATAADLLPYGDYEIVERSGNQPTGYLNTGKTSQKFSISENGKIVNLKTDAGAIKNNPIRGSFYLEKWDYEINRNTAQGSGKLDATVEIVNASKHLVLVDGVEYQPNEVVLTFTLSEAGQYQSVDRLLPYGTYQYRETAVPSQGYLPTGVLSGYFTIRTDGENVMLNTTTTAIKNDPIRGDLKGVKISDGDGKRMAGIPFSITSVTTGESHTVITDKNGQFDTSSAWNPHSQNTNRGETDRDGVWFGELWTLDDDNGALLYDTYLLEEQPCAANEDRELLSFEVSIYRHLTVVDLGTVTNDYTQTPEIFTTARDQESTTGDAHVSEQTTILDTVYYSGLVVGKDYTVKGVLMDQATGNPLLVDGQEVTAEKMFKALSETGNVTMEFTFNSTALAGKSVVVFESLEYEGKEIAAHTDIEDAGQTVTFKNPKIGTTASGLTGEKELDILGEATVMDVVAFENLIVGQTYTLKGVLMDKETGEPLLIEGKEITAEKSFIPKSGSGTVEMSFTVGAAALKGKTVVVFESLEYNEREIALHADIEDEGQTVTFKNPKIGTSATGTAGEKEIINSKTATIVDVVTYEGLAVGKTYTVKGVLMDKATGDPLTVDGQQITAETTFVAKEASGSVEVVFTLDATALAGKSVVVFENLYYEDIEIAVHADIEDEGQTVTFTTPKIGTTAKTEDGSKIIPVAESAKVIDTVSYENLVIGEKYTVKGVLMDKETGKALLVDGKEVTAEKSFILKEASGSVDVVFTFNTTALQDKILVVFESLEYEGKEIAAHADINDDAQTVGVGVEILTDEPVAGQGTGAKTGRDGLPLWLLIAAIGAVATATLLVTRKKIIFKKKQAADNE